MAPHGGQNPSTYRFVMATTDAAPHPQVLGRPASATDWAQAHGKKVLFIALAIGALIAGYYVYTNTQARKAERAERALGEAQQGLVTGNAAAARTSLQGVTARYGDTPAGVQAAIYLAQLQFDEKKYAEGIGTLENAAGQSASEPSRAAIYNLVGSAYEEQGKFAEAATAYRRASAAAILDSERTTMRANEARALTRANRLDEARRIWTDLADDPTGAMAGEARVRLGELDAKAAGQR